MTALPGPGALRAALPLPPAAAELAGRGRRDALAVLSGADPRLLVVVGPCSVHDPDGAREYARELKPVADGLSGELLVVLRCYVEKSRTGGGWRGLARDPAMDNSLGTGTGLDLARSAFLAMLAEGLPVGTELVSPFLWPYWADALSWASVGARGVESQALREAAQALDCACGFKNGRDGRIDTALNAVEAASGPGTTLVIGEDGTLSERRVAANPFPHLILRGGDRGPNWRKAPAAAARLSALGLPPAIMVDASHGNSGRDPLRQGRVAMAALELRARGVPVRGIMLESYLEDGCQALEPGRRPSARLSVTDPCLGLEKTRRLLESLALGARKSRPV